jgi:EAL domain-containing protein (putative c-di-GMP-specific phosphodiesterase class I)
VIEQACIAAAKWPGRVVVAVNISMAQLGKTNIVETVTNALSRSGLPADRLARISHG